MSEHKEGEARLEAQKALIKAVLSKYYMTRLADLPTADHILKYPRVQQAFAALPAASPAMQHKQIATDQASETIRPVEDGLVEALGRLPDLAFSELPKEQWSCSDDASGTAITLGRQRRYIHGAIKAAVDSILASVRTQGEG